MSQTRTENKMLPNIKCGILLVYIIVMWSTMYKHILLMNYSTGSDGTQNSKMTNAISYNYDNITSIVILYTAMVLYFQSDMGSVSASCTKRRINEKRRLRSNIHLKLTCIHYLKNNITFAKTGGRCIMQLAKISVDPEFVELTHLTYLKKVIKSIKHDDQ